MKHTLAIALLLVATVLPRCQEVQYITDDECGCELVLVDDIETTRSGDLYGFRRIDGTVIAPNQYRFVDQFHGDYCRVMIDHGAAGMIDRNGREVVPCIYDDVSYPSCGRIMVAKNQLAGFCDLNGMLVIPLQFYNVSDFHNNYATAIQAIGNTNTACFIDTLGNRQFCNGYDNARPFNEGYAIVRRNGMWGMIDTTGREVLPVAFGAITVNSGGLFFAGEEEGLALYNYTMQPLTAAIYTDPGTVENGLVAATLDGKRGYLDSTGRTVVPFVYDELGLFREGRTQARIGQKYGIVDTAGRVILPIIYDNTRNRGTKYMYYDSRALVEKDGHVGYVDLDGNLVIPMYFEHAYPFSQGLAAAKFNGMWGYIDTAGEVFMPFIFDLAGTYHYGRAEVMYNGHTSKVDLKGRCVKNCNGVIAWREIHE